MEKNFKEIGEELWNSKKKKSEGLKIFSGNLTLNLE